MKVQAIEIQARGLCFPALSCGEGPLVLVQHGFPDLPEGFSGMLTALAEAGYRAVAPTLRGYAPGCLPPLRDAHALEASLDLDAFVHALGSTRAALVGHDWGAVAAYLCAGRARPAFACIATLAIPNLSGLPRALPRVPRQLRRSWYQAFFALPSLPERWFGRRAEAVVEWAYRTWSPGYTPPPEHLERVQAALRVPSQRDAALEYYRALFRPGLRQLRTLDALRPPRVPTLCLFGERDGCMDAELYGPAAPRTTRVPFESRGLAGVGHFLHMEAPERVHTELLRFLQEHYPAR